MIASLTLALLPAVAAAPVLQARYDPWSNDSPSLPTPALIVAIVIPILFGIALLFGMIKCCMAYQVSNRAIDVAANHQTRPWNSHTHSNNMMMSHHGGYQHNIHHHGVMYGADGALAPGNNPSTYPPTSSFAANPITQPPPSYSFDK